MKEEVARLASTEVSSIFSDSSTAADPLLRIEATVSRLADDKWRLALRESIDDQPKRTRTIEGVTCEAVAQAAALVVAVAITPRTLSTEGAPRDAAITPTTAVSRLAERRPVVPGRPAVEAHVITEPDAPKLSLRLIAGGELGSRPALSPGAAGAIALVIDRVGLEITLARWFPTTALLAGQAIGGEFDLVAGAARGCWTALLADPFETALCAGPELGRLQARSRGTAQAFSGSSVWWAASLGALLVYRPTARIGVVSELGLSWPFTRHRFIIETLGEVYRPAPVSLRLGLGLEIKML
jgi:hypothetical protein